MTIRGSIECEASLSKAAYTGGITNAFIEVTSPTVFSSLNLHPLQVISHHEELYSSSNIVKIYLSQPDCYTPHTEDTTEIILEANEIGKVVIIDCSINDPRLLALASPFRTEPEIKRLESKVYTSQIYASSIESNIKDTDS